MDKKNLLIFAEISCNVIFCRIKKIVKNHQTFDCSNDNGENTLDKIIEKASISWFLRFVMLRYMEVQEIAPCFLAKNFSEDFMLDYLDEQVDDELSVDEMYKLCVVKHLNSMQKKLPFLFTSEEQYVNDYFPLGIQQDSEFVDQLLSFDKSNFSTPDVVGWLYQYFIADKKAKIYADIKLGKKIGQTDIAKATQIFTPDWIVGYMVENTLYKKLQNDFDYTTQSDKYQYYITEIDSKIKPEKQDIKQLKFIDIAMGSGHILAYAFDVLFDYYTASGLDARSAVFNILQNNLYGIDIDFRAYQLSSFVLLMKASQKCGDALIDEVKPNLFYTIDTSSLKSINFAQIFSETKAVDINNLDYLINKFSNSQNFGSLVKLKDIDYKELAQGFRKYQSAKLNTLQTECLNKILPVLELANVLSSKYDIVATNPPYMGLKSMNKDLKQYLNDNYKSVRNDLAVCFMEQSLFMLKRGGYLTMINQHSWMYLSSFKDFRRQLIKNTAIVSMLHLGVGAFDDIEGQVVQSTAFVLYNGLLSNKEGLYFDLTKLHDGLAKKSEYLSALSTKNSKIKYLKRQDEFIKIAGFPLAYSLSQNMINIFERASSMKGFVDVKQGLATSDNQRFVKKWTEVNFDEIYFDAHNTAEAKASNYTWFPYSKGGARKKWYGNCSYVVNYKNDGDEIKSAVMCKYPYLKNPDFVVKNTNFYFKSALTWGLINTGGFSARLRNTGFIHDVASMSAFTDNKQDLKYLLGLINTPISDYIFKVLNPTFNVQVGDFMNFPVLVDPTFRLEVIDLVNKCIEIAKLDWDMYETSWHFLKTPLLLYDRAMSFAEIYQSFKGDVNQRFYQLKSYEERLNDLFITLYGLESELTPTVAESDLTITKVVDDKTVYGRTNRQYPYLYSKKDFVLSFLSYFVGLSFGRYSLDQAGLIFAGGKFCYTNYKSYKPLRNNLLPLSVNAKFDVSDMLLDFVKTYFGSENYLDNVNFICSVLTDRGSSQETIRYFFEHDFYNYHYKIYGKKPIYHIVQLGKKAAFYLEYDKRNYESTNNCLKRYLKSRVKYLESQNKRLHKELKKQKERNYQRRIRRQIKKNQAMVAEIEMKIHSEWKK